MEKSNHQAYVAIFQVTVIIFQKSSSIPLQKVRKGIKKYWPARGASGVSVGRSHICIHRVILARTVATLFTVGEKAASAFC